MGDGYIRTHNPIGKVMGKAKNKEYLKKGFRSGFEDVVAEDVKKKGKSIKFEPFKIKYTRPAKDCWYVPDFLLPNNIIVETKGYMPVAERKKFLNLKTEYPEADIRFVFQNPNNKLERSKTTYSQWAEKHGFKWASKLIPDDWWLEAKKWNNWEIKTKEKK